MESKQIGVSGAEDWSAGVTRHADVASKSVTLVPCQVRRIGGSVKHIRWEALFADGWKEVSVEDLLFRLIGSGLIRAYREKQ